MESNSDDCLAFLAVVYRMTVSLKFVNKQWTMKNQNKIVLPRDRKSVV